MSVGRHTSNHHEISWVIVNLARRLILQQNIVICFQVDVCIADTSNFGSRLIRMSCFFAFDSVANPSLFLFKSNLVLDLI